MNTDDVVVLYFLQADIILQDCIGTSIITPPPPSITLLPITELLRWFMLPEEAHFLLNQPVNIIKNRENRQYGKPLSWLSGYVPAISAVTESLPAISAVTESIPAISAVTESVPAISAVTVFVPAISAVTESIPANSAVTEPIVMCGLDSTDECSPCSQAYNMAVSEFEKRTCVEASVVPYSSTGQPDDFETTTKTLLQTMVDHERMIGVNLNDVVVVL